MVFVVQLLYKRIYHSNDTSHHRFHKTQVINFPYISIYTEIEGHIRSCSTSSRHKESPLFPPLNLFLAISSTGAVLSVTDYSGCLSSMQSATFQGIHFPVAHLGLFLQKHSREKEKAVQHTSAGNWGISTSQRSLIGKAGVESWP